MSTGPEEGTAAGRGHFRAAHADREHAIDTLKTAFADGRLTKDELDARAGQALTARTYAELAALTADIPAGPPVAPSPRQPARLRNRTHHVRNATIGSVSCLSVAAAAFLYGVSLDDHNTPLFLLLTFFALIAIPLIIANAAITSWQQRHPRGQLPPRPGQSSQPPAVPRRDSTGRDPSPPSARPDQTREDQTRTDQTRADQARTDQTRTDLRAHRSRPDRSRPHRRGVPAPRAASPAPGAA